MSRFFSHTESPVQNITTAYTAHSDEMNHRMRKYALAMGIRVVCLVMLFLVPGWWKIVPIIGAVFIPWFAVVIANGGGDTTHPDESALLDQAPQNEITGASTIHDDGAAAASSQPSSPDSAASESGSQRTASESAQAAGFDDGDSHAGAESSMIIPGELWEPTEENEAAQDGTGKDGQN